MGAVCNVSHFNMISGHAYGLIGAVTLKGGAHDGMRMLKTRNPWGTNKYDGPWSEKSADWTPEYRKQADNYGTDNIGDIWLPLDIWSDDYADLSVNLFRDDWKITTVEGADFKYDVLWGDLNTWLTIDNPVEQEVVMECYQNDQRMFPDHCESENAPLFFNFQWMDDAANPNYTIKNQKSGGNAGGSCQGDAMYVKKLPAGKTQVRVVNYAGSNKGHKTLYELKAYGAKEALKITQQKGNTYIIA